jgi:peptidyl-prolyl cis-trans isomerase A (cyclophilin A)
MPLLVMVAALGAKSCKKTETPPAEPPPAAPPPAPPPAPAENPPAEPAKPAETAPAEKPQPTRGLALDPAKLTERAPARYRARFSTTKGDFVVEVHRDWAPNGADRFYNLVKAGYFDGTRFFRVIRGFMVQWGIHGEPPVNATWREARIKDDPVKESNKRGFITFAMAGPDSRTTQVFINFTDNGRLDSAGFPPFGKVVSGMNVIDSLHAEYGEGPPSGAGPSQPRMQDEGNAYLDKEFPKLDSIKQARIVR